MFAGADEGFFDNAVYPTSKGWEVLLARGTRVRVTEEAGEWAGHTGRVAKIGRMAVLQDPQGAVIQVISYVPMTE